MRIGMIGLGRMGGNIARRLQRSGHQPVVFDRNPDAVAELALEGSEPADSLEEIKKKLGTEAIFWVMLPAGEPTEKTIQILRTIAEPGDVIIDGGNSFYKDDIRRAKLLADKGIHYIDVGTSGGVWGLERGYCMMIGGPRRPSTISIRSSTRSRRASAPFRGRQTGWSMRERMRARRAISTPDLPAPVTSSRWCTTASNTA
jgi:6-phosphogluconate dehydrogenase